MTLNYTQNVSQPLLEMFTTHWSLHNEYRKGLYIYIFCRRRRRHRRRSSSNSCEFLIYCQFQFIEILMSTFVYVLFTCVFKITLST